ncbi:putative nucleic-acid-binding protein containing a Zn-ribbon [Methanomethylovorans hollandica DSM 15978]|uniref:Putative nucleic-acid-binding protein containing a Zn-ribbon n=1 Tax=Methanomethylovorans hollandica (strain DSM 15978 / NBRC 107637 / DMS1) TaxID=867904 RepID=L0L279_METHD|nr:Zn-ribbon domain-containing OB-fold protein [Methanomethylovorans hollandica]AGB50523.1 putative nucleic-acid-binding protein containing a Zn-ribbon [Methanomethylovorans hollandica DSM 15978]
MSVPRFWRKQVARYNLIGTHCTNCETYYYPPRNMCPKCRRDGKLENFKFSGKGEVLTYTVIHTAAEGFEKQTPYVLGIVKLDEGPSLTSQIVADPGAMKIGMKVRPVFRKLGESGEKGMIYYGTKFVPE